MDCPKCKEAMIVLELRQIEIDYCTSCSGIWLDKGELELLVGDQQEQQDTVLSDFVPQHRSKEKAYRCPICRKKMEKVLSGKQHQILIDRCHNHHGLWFDAGELHLLIESYSGKEDPVVSLLNEMFRYNLKKQ